MSWKSKEFWIRAGVLVLVFIVASLIFSLITNRRSGDLTRDMDAPTFPQVCFVEGDYQVNTLAGYRSEMDVTTMRDTIIPSDASGDLDLKIRKYGNTIDSVSYEILSLDGKESLASDTVEETKGEATIPVRDVLKDQVEIGEEAILVVTLQVDEKPIYYYTRVVMPEDQTLIRRLDFANDLNTKTFTKSANAEWSGYLETDMTADDSDYETVSIKSDVSRITWSNLNPERKGEIDWQITEHNDSYTSVLMKYQVICQNEEGQNHTYNIREFYKVRSTKDNMYLLDYHRTMRQVFDETTQVLTEKGISLGITSGSDVAYDTNEDGNIVSFVTENDLWNYNKEADQLSLIFSFSNTEGDDVRNRNDQHQIRILGMEEDGSTTFAVYGYMNRGSHEGQVGVDIFYYDISTSSIEERVFIPSDKSPDIMEQELGKMVYYSRSQEMLYVLAGGVLYQGNLGQGLQVVLAEDLKVGQYAVSEDGKLLAYQTNGSLNTATEIQVMDLDTGESFTVINESGENVKPLGFVNGDFVYGISRQADMGTSVSGEELQPMYKLEICNDEGEVLKDYQVEGAYISDVLIDGSMITVNRLEKQDAVYSGSSADYITSNKAEKEHNISLESIISEDYGKIWRLTYADGISDREPKVLKPKFVMAERPAMISLEESEESREFYAYGHGELIGVYDRAVYAIQNAELVSGVAVTSEQKYIWEQSNRYLVYESETESFTVQEGESTVDACRRLAEAQGGQRVDMTGCTIEQVLYLMNRGGAVIAMTDAQNAVLLTAYNTSDTAENITYINPADGSENTVSLEEMNAMIAGSGNTLVGYISK